ncbi:unnamed protein product [Kuraishia capsulata CBS 1993]|uniref:FAD dependent oxidoreductase domain-containing protein n=1 Tax=Kuraishia capsulata CBS 1993 TaxID=1382522 RepID=W6MS65_9ASCO|nr:uncharacterized protein KUCA_T00005231001 [Kuraishia capsulata CBS 1993]CDK29243.1 unnamed protein product [Kuraishia capsulata CBS 1993]
MDEYYSSTPSNKHEGKTHIIIVGAGIIGVCSAFYLTRHPKFDKEKYHITILESKRVAGGASGKAGGLLALWAFPQQIVPLSFQLHQDLAEEFSGAENWGFRRLTTVSVEGDLTKENAARPASKAKRVTKNSIKIHDQGVDGNSNLPPDLNWLDPEVVQNWNHLGGESTTAQVHPYQFTTHILKQCLATGAVELLIGKVDDITVDEEGTCTGVLYSPSSLKSTVDGSADTQIQLDGEKVLMTIGPWTSKILPDCPISGLRAHSITIEPENVSEISPYAIFTELKLSNKQFTSPEIYARKDEVYVCGEGDTSVPIPSTTDDVEVVTEKCDELFKLVGKVSSHLANGKILKRQACYLPVLDVPSSSGPLIGETNVDNLYLASGHSCWGINNAPVTGLLMSEILLDGEATSCDISALDPASYFDASVPVDI